MRKQTTIPVLAAAAVLFLAAGTARANGFYIQEMSGSVVGQAGAVVAAGGRPTNQYQNAANLSFSDGMYLEFSGTTYFLAGAYENPQGVRTEANTPVVFVPYLFGSYRVNDWLAVGIAEFTAFGLKMRWPSDWEGRTLAMESALETFTLNPNISFGPFKGFAIAVGFDAMHGSFSIKRGLNLGQPAPGDTADNTITMKGAAWGYGANVGLMYQPADWVRIGVAWRSGIKITDKKGTVDFDVGRAWASRFPDQYFKGSLSLPHVVMGGVRFWPRKDLSIELDAQWVQWSAYNKLKFELSEGLVLGPGAKQTTLEESKRWKDAVQVRVGMEWVGLNDHLAVRAGFLWDQNPVPDDTVDPSLPDTQRLMPCVSIGGQWKGVYVDLGYMPVFGLKREVKAGSGAPLTGTYPLGVTHDVVFTVGYHWDKAPRAGK